VITFSSNDYLGLSGHPEVVEACRREALGGVGSGAARALGGTRSVHLELEAAIARFEGTESALVVGSGYAANVALLSGLLARGDVVASDELNHASIIDGCRIAGVTTLVHPHARPAELPPAEGSPRVWITDGVFSMDGDVARLPDVVAEAEAHGALVVVDEAHATGVVGETGRGTGELFGLAPGDRVTVGTLSKALGCSGGFVAGPAAIVEEIRSRARTYVFSTALPPPIAAAALAALRVLDAEPNRVEALRTQVAHLRTRVAELGYAVADTPSAITPLHVGDVERARRLSDRLHQRGFVVPALSYPIVPLGQDRLRVVVTAAHGYAEIEGLVEALGESGHDLP
jgi:8-amino-7-oxononanoate synthase